MNPREAATIALGLEDVEAYERVKRFYTRFGLALERTFANAVGGRVGGRGEPDVVTPLGVFEFCASANAKNADGELAQQARVAGRGYVVQVSGELRPGRISAAEFLRLHGLERAELVDELLRAALELAREPQQERLFA